MKLSAFLLKRRRRRQIYGFRPTLARLGEMDGCLLMDHSFQFSIGHSGTAKAILTGNAIIL